MRFAFYGRTSTVEHQDRFTSCSWQREVAETVIAGRGAIVREFFDMGCSRRQPWAQRPQAAALLAELQAADRPFDAVVVGEYERAFYGDQFSRVAVALDRYGIQVGLSEAGGPVDVGEPDTQMLMTVLWRAVAARGPAFPAPGVGRDAGSGDRPGALPRWSAAVRVSAG